MARSTTSLISTGNVFDPSGNSAHSLRRTSLLRIERSVLSLSFAKFPLFLLSLMWLLCASAPWANAQSTPTLSVGNPTTDANGVEYYPVTSVYQDSQQQIIRVLEPTNPAPGQPPKILFVLPVDTGVDTTASTYSDGLEELRMLDVQDRFNMTLIAPSFNYEPWYGDNVTDPTLRMESFIIDDLVPFGDQFAQGSVPQRYLIGFSKSGNGVLFLLLRHPGVFNAGAAWDSPAQLSDINTTGISTPGAIPENFGTQANFDLYNIPSLVSSNAQPFLQQNRFWISGDQAAWTADMDQLNDQMTAAEIPHTWVQGGTRVHSWNSGWLDGAVTDLDSNATLTAPYAGTLPPPRSGGLPGGTLSSGTTQATLSLTTDQAAICAYATSAGVAYGSMTNTFSVTGGTAHSTVVTGLQDGGSYSYYVRCQDNATGAVNSDDYAISFSVAISSGGSADTASSSFAGVEDPLSENGMWGTTGSWTSLKKDNGVYSTDITSAARLLTPAVGADQYSEIAYDQDPGTASWPGVMTRVQGANNGSGYLAIAYAGQVRLYRADDTGSLNFTLLASADAVLATAPRLLRLESAGSTHSVYFNGTLMITYTDAGNTYSAGQPGIADSVFGGPTVRILSFDGGALAGSGNTPPPTPPARSGGLPGGTLSSGTTQATLSLTTDQAAICAYATSAGVAYGSMTNTFSVTGGTAHSTVVTGLQDGGSYSYYVRCQDNATGAVNSDDYAISFSVAISSGGSADTASSSFAGVEDPLSENGMWGTTGSWTSLKKDNGVYSTDITSAARLLTPAVGADQYSEIAYDQDPGTASWPGVMTRVQGANNGSGYLAIAYAGQVRLYRADDTGSLNFTLLASADAVLATAPRLLRLESAGSTHSVYFNGTLMITYTDAGNTYSAGQPGIADSVFGGPTVRILSFDGGALAGSGNTPPPTPPARSGGLPGGTLSSGTTQATLSLTTDQAAICAYATSAGVAYGSMTNTFSVTGGTAHSTVVTGLQDGGSYSYYVRCQDNATGAVNSDDYAISFSVAISSGGSADTASSSFAGVEDPLSENGMWGTTGSWTSLKKDNGVYSTDITSAARLLTPAVGADQYSEIAYDQDPGTASWPGVMTRVQGANNGSGYLAIAYAGQVRLYRADDTGSLNFTLLASADAVLATAPRLLRLESAGSTHSVYFNGTLMITYTDAGNTYSAGQPGIADSVFGGPTVRILSFSGGALASN